MRFNLLSFATLALISSATITSQGGTVYVSPTGTGTGATCESAAELSNALILSLSEGDTVVAAAGTYVLNETLALTNALGKAVSLTGSSENRESVVLKLAEGVSAPIIVMSGGVLSDLTFRDVSVSSVHFMSASGGSVQNCYFSNCKTTSNCYLIYTTASFSVSNCLFEACTASSLVFDNARKGNPILDTDFIDCQGVAGSYGGVARDGKLFRCRIVNYTVKNEEAFIYTKLYDCLVTGVTGRLLREAECYNCTIVGNYNAMSSPRNFYNCIIHNNRTSSKEDAALSTLSGTYYGCWIDEGATGGTRSACITGDDPRVLANGALGAGSPCIDSGTASYYTGNEMTRRPVDLLGNVRSYGESIDIGCCEKTGYADGEEFLGGNAVQVSSVVGEEVCLAFSYRADAGVVVTISWDFGDGAQVSPMVMTANGGSVPETSSVTHVYSVGGLFDVSATATFSDGSEPLLFVAKGKFVIQNAEESDVYVSPAGNDANTGTSASSPKRTIASAVVSVRPGHVVHIANGTYAITSHTSVEKSVEVVGESRDGVLLTGASDTSMFTINNANAIFRDFTVYAVTNAVLTGALFDLQDGLLANVSFEKCATTAANGIVVVSKGRTTEIVSNCSFRACSSVRMIAAGNNRTPRVLDCTFDACTGSDHGSMIQGCKGIRCRFDKCLFRNSLLIYCDLFDSLMTGCVAAGPLCESAAYNCTFTCNSNIVVNAKSGGGSNYNCIFWGNGGTESYGKFYYCLMDKSTESVRKDGCITDGDPDFKRGFAIGARSSAIDKGNLVYYTGATYLTSLRSIDLYGNVRSKGESVDIGCCEFSGKGLLLVIR